MVVVADVEVEVSAVRLKMVDDAVEINPCSVGLMENTVTPVPVSSPSTPASKADVWSDVDASLVLKFVQSVDDKRPLTVPLAAGKLKVKVPLELVMPQSLLMAVVEVASVMAPT